MFDIYVGMYGILVLCLLLRPLSFSSDNNTTASQPSTESDERQARDGDYIGCYPQDCLGFDYHEVLSNTTTPDTCTATCKENGFVLAALYNRTECACSCEQICLTRQLDDTICGLPCRRDLSRLCGGFAGASYYVVQSVNTSKSKCTENNTGGTDGREEVRTPTQIYIAAGIGSAVIIVLIIVFAFLRKSDRRVVYSPRNQSRRWRAHTPSQDNEGRPPNDTQATSNRLPPRHMSGTHQASGVESTSQTQTRRDGEPAIAVDIRDTMPVAGSSFYHVLTEEDGEETRSECLSLATENAYAYADCRAYIDSFPRSAACVQRMAEMPRYPKYNEQVEHEMVNNELYAISKK